MWTPIREQYLYGYQATQGRYKVEIVRIYAGSWQIFYSIGKYAYMPTYGLSHVFRYQTAKKIAAQWLRQKGAQRVR